jgi:hypothetical protein
MDHANDSARVELIGEPLRGREHGFRRETFSALVSRDSPPRFRMVIKTWPVTAIETGKSGLADQLSRLTMLYEKQTVLKVRLMSDGPQKAAPRVLGTQRGEREDFRALGLGVQRAIAVDVLHTGLPQS